MTAFHKNPGSSELHKKGLFNAIEFPEVGLFTVVLDEKFYCIKYFGRNCFAYFVVFRNLSCDCMLRAGG